ncbi:MAG: hypothetical protein U0984_05775 [Prosthecobacter sp.]|nr:hypothetical protein [Prosthecobacter sp.]
MVDPAAPADDFAAINQGQLKHLAKAAYLEMEERLTGGAGAAVTALVSGWQTPTSSTDDFAAVTAGQLKAAAKPFYDRLIQAGVLPAGSGYPWEGPELTVDDYALVNIGQAKALFAFPITSSDSLVMTGLYYQQSVEGGGIAPYGIGVMVSQGGQPVSELAVTFELVSSAGALFETAESPLQSGLIILSDGSGHAGCGFRAPLAASYCWIRASATGVSSQWFLMIVGGGGAGGFPTHPPGAADVTFSLDSDGDGLADADELAMGTNPGNRDTDGDSVSDYNEVRGGTDPADPSSNALLVTGLRVWNVFR